MWSSGCLHGASRKEERSTYCANLGSDITGPFTKNEQDKKPGLIMTFETLFCIDKVGAKMSLRFFLRAMPKE